MILVTGAAGFTGRFVVEELRRRGRPVRMLCRAEPPAWAAGLGAEAVTGDLGDAASLARAARGTRGIVHAACTYTDSRIDIAAMEALVGSWQGGAFVYISTLDVYGLASGLLTEDAPVCETYNEYSRGKVVCERVLAEAGAARGGGHVMLRAPYIWGPHARPRKRLVSQRLEEGRPIVLPGADPTEWREYQDVWIDVRDLAVIVADSLDRPAGGPLNVATGHFCWHDLHAEIIRLTGSRSEIVHKPLEEISEEELPQAELYAQTWRFSEARLAAHLGSIPRRPFDVTVRDTVMHRERPG